MNRSDALRPWVWSVWALVAVACSSTTTLPPPLADCQGSRDAECSVTTGAGGAGAAGGTGASDDSGSTTSSTESCGAAATSVAAVLQAPSQACEPCIATGGDSSTDGNCCLDAIACPAGSSCQLIIQCAVTCLGSTACVSNCVNQYPAGATAFNDLNDCLGQTCNPECPSFTVSVASEQ